jgi:hypothetical protein
MAQERWADFFTLLDANKNGSIEKADAAAAVKVWNGGRGDKRRVVLAIVYGLPSPILLERRERGDA